MASEIAPYFWKRFTSSILVQDTHSKVMLVAGVNKEVGNIVTKFKAILSAVRKAEATEMHHPDVRDWLNKVNAISFYMDDVLDEYNTCFLRLQTQIERLEDLLIIGKKVRFFLPTRFFFPIVDFCRQSAVLLKQINDKVDDINDKPDYIFTNTMLNPEEVKSSGKQIESTYSLGDEDGICSWDEEKNTLISRLLCESSKETNSLRVILMVGIREIETTGLARWAYDCIAVVRNFDIRRWISLSDPCDEFVMASVSTEAVNGAPKLIKLVSLLSDIREDIGGKKFLFIFNMEIAHYEKWKSLFQSLNSGLHGSRIVIITWEDEVAHKMEADHIINIPKLLNKESWFLLSRLAFIDRSYEEYRELEEVGIKIEDNCQGLPLVLKTLGSLLRFKRTRAEWESHNEMWNVEEFEKRYPLIQLFLNYNHMPPMIRLCLLYFTVFPKEYKMKRDTLIRLWMAQGYLGLEPNIDMETIGRRYYHYLAAKSLLQELKEDDDDDDDDDIISCKRHNAVDDFTAQFLSKNEDFVKEVKHLNDSFNYYSHAKKFHLMLVRHQGVSVLRQSIIDSKRRALRSLLICGSDSRYSLVVDDSLLTLIFGELIFLRTLILDGSGISITEIPTQIKELLHLRYLDLSGQPIKKLPETLCELYNLQTLDLTKCEKLEKLPQGMERLINLRHLINYETTSLHYMPSGIERLTCLRTLSEFIVNVGGHDSKYCTFKCLKDLNHLQGKLKIKVLENEANLQSMDALQKKQKLVNLVLKFGKDGEGEGMEKDHKFELERVKNGDALVLKSLLPPPNLEKLNIENYRGKNFSFNWEMSLTKLKELMLLNCMYCEHLPPLGKLPSLESLYIGCMPGVERVGIEFLGFDTDGTSSSSSTTLFGKLKKLEFWKMENWKEWDYGASTTMPCLASFSISQCPILEKLPQGLLQSMTLKKLHIYECLKLRKLYKETVEGRRSINHNRNVEIDFEYVTRGSE